MKRVTLDSNVYVSGLRRQAKARPRNGHRREIDVAVSDPIIQEGRRHLLGKFGWSEPRAAQAVQSISEFAKRASNKPRRARV